MALSLTATPETSPSGIPRVRLVVAGATGPQVYIYRRDPNGRTLTVRQASPGTLAGTGLTVYDYEAPFDADVSYSVQDGSATAYTAGYVTLTSAGTTWLVHPGMPELSVPLHVLEWPTWTRPVVRGIFTPLGRTNRVVISSRRFSVEGTLQTYTASANDRAAVLAILADGSALLLKGTETEGAGTRWVSVGDVDETPVELDLREFTLWSLPLIEVDAPSGRALPPATYADASATFYDYAQASAQATTYADRTGGEWKV